MRQRQRGSAPHISGGAMYQQAMAALVRKIQSLGYQPAAPCSDADIKALDAEVASKLAAALPSEYLAFLR